MSFLFQPITALSRWIDSLGPGAFTLLALGLLAVFLFTSAIGTTVFMFSNWTVKRERNLGFVHNNRWYEFIYRRARTNGGMLILAELMVLGLLLGVLSFGSVVSLFYWEDRITFTGDWSRHLSRYGTGWISLLLFAIGGAFTAAATIVGLWRYRLAQGLCQRVHEIETTNAAKRH